MIRYIIIFTLILICISIFPACRHNITDVSTASGSEYNDSEEIASCDEESNNDTKNDFEFRFIEQPKSMSGAIANT